MQGIGAQAPYDVSERKSERSRVARAAGGRGRWCQRARVPVPRTSACANEAAASPVSGGTESEIARDYEVQ